MNKSDKFYLKQGKLELSMLDDDDDDDDSFSASKQKNLDDDSHEQIDTELLFPHTKRRRDSRVSNSPKVKVSSDIYNTLHVMGQLLTKNDDTTNSLPVKKPVNAAKVQMIEQLASNVKVQDMTLPPMPSKEERLLNVSITSADEIRETGVDISLFSGGEKNEEIRAENRNWYKLEKEADLQDAMYDEKGEAVRETVQPIETSSEKEAIDHSYVEAFNRLNENVVLDHQLVNEISEQQLEQQQEHTLYEEKAQEADERYSAEMEKTIKESYDSVSTHHIEGKKEIEAVADNRTNGNDVEEFQDSKQCQKDVDRIVESFFDSRVPQYSFTRDLKRHIEKHIRALKEEKTNFTN